MTKELLSVDANLIRNQKVQQQSRMQTTTSKVIDRIQHQVHSVNDLLRLPGIYTAHQGFQRENYGIIDRCIERLLEICVFMSSDIYIK